MNLIKKTFFTILICSFLFGGERIAVATKVIGSVEFIRGKDFSKSLKKGHIIESGDILKTKKGGFAAIIFVDDKSALKIKENTELEIVGNTKNQSIAKRISLINGTVRAQVENQKNKDFIVQTSVSVASVKGTDFWVISDKSKGDSIIGIEGVIQLANKISGEIIDIRKGITGLSSNNGKLESFNTDPKTIPSDPSGDDTVNQKIRIEFIDASGKKKILVIEYQ
tara:strand:+ start:1407 stop:2078 length:672 start_codon:yes stop_codon:yes gene_type:complete